LTLPSLDPVTRCRRYAEWVGSVGHSDMLLPWLTDYCPAPPQGEQQAFAPLQHAQQLLAHDGYEGQHQRQDYQRHVCLVGHTAPRLLTDSSRVHYIILPVF
jgi:hypothetical protein